MDNRLHAQEQMEAVVAHLAARREDILHAWRTALDRDPHMTTGASLPRAQLNDHVPDLLEDLASGCGLRSPIRAPPRPPSTAPMRQRMACSAGSKATICAR